MNIELGWTYKFVFTKEFESLNGIYTTVKFYSYDEFVNDSLNLYELLYTKVNRSEADFEQDLITIREQKIIKLKNPDNYDDILYIPEFIISEVPNYNVKKYAKLVLALPIGVYPGEEELNSIKDLLQQQILGEYGITDDIASIIIKYIWLTTDEYEEEKTKRNDITKTITNHYTENKKLIDEVDRLKSIIKCYEKLFKDWAPKYEEAIK